MYIKVYLNFFHDKTLNSLTDIYLYSFLCGFAKEGEEKVRSHYVNEQLVDILGCSSQTISNSITRLEKLGLVERKTHTGFSQKIYDFYCTRTLITDTSLYNKLATEHYITVQSSWLTDWKLPIRATQILGLFNTMYHMSGKRNNFITSHKEIMEMMGNVNYRTYLNNYTLLKDLGFVKEHNAKSSSVKVIELMVKNLDEDIDAVDIMKSESLEETAKECKTLKGKSSKLVAWVKRFLRNRSDAFINKVLRILEPTATVRKTLEPLWQAFDYYERESIRATIPEDADHRDGYFVQGGILADG